MRKLIIVALAAAVLAPAAAAQRPDVHVHGHWQIVVRSHAGRVVAKRVFHNAYVPGPALAMLLAQQATPGGFAIWLSKTGSGAGTSPCVGSPDTCYLTGPGIPVDPARASFGGLTWAPKGNDLVLTATFVATRDGTIDHVRTVIAGCAPTSAPTPGCPLALSYVFTQHDLPTPVAVSKDQQVAVTVTISFT